MRKIFTRLLVTTLLTVVTFAFPDGLKAQVETGNVYNFVSIGSAGNSMVAYGISNSTIAATDTGDFTQLWYIGTGTASGSYTVRNLGNGLYLKGAGQSATWGFSREPSDLFCVEAGSGYTFSVSNSTSGHDKMHYGANNYGNIVGWETSSDATQWTMNKQTITDDIQSRIDEISTLDGYPSNTSTYQTALNELFTDASCTTPKLASLDAATSSTAYSNLPATLQKMVEKVYSENFNASTTAWDEDNADDSKASWESKYAKKFRVQMYEPYSIADGDGIISFLGINSHANNDNPTGIYMHEPGILYVMVEGTIGDGATLRLVDAGTNDRITYPTGKGEELKTGLNVLPYYKSGGHFYVCYNVETYDPDTKEFNHKLSDFAPLKIHIEGGAISGFYNAQGDFRASATDGSDDLWKVITGASVDCDDDWVYLEERANLSVVPVLGHRQILLFSLNTTSEGDNGMSYYLPENLDIPTKPYSRTGKWSDLGLGIPDEGYDGYKVNIMMEAWDRIMYSQLATMGLLSADDMNKMNDLYPRWKADNTYAEMYDFSGASAVDGKTYQQFCDDRDYGEFFNHHGVALGVGGNSYMYGSGDHCGYHHNTMGGIIQNIANNAGSTWGPAHEIGHQHQDTYLLNGQTEVTNNLFANVALWYKGMTTSRYNGSNGSLENVLSMFNSNDETSQYLQMTQDGNIWAFTHLYYRLWLYYHLAGNNTQFWPRLYELLRVEPLQNGSTISGDKSTLLFYKHACTAAGEDLTEFFRAHGFLSVMDNCLVGDYANAYYTVTQDMIDTAIAEVKAMRDSEGNPLRENLAILFINDDDETANYVQHDGTTEREIYGETTPNSDFGSVSDFISGEVSVSTAYTASVSADGTVTMSGGTGGVGFLVLNEEGEIVSFSNKSTFELNDEAAYLLATGKATISAVDTESAITPSELDLSELQRTFLVSLIAKVEAMPIDDGTYTHIGFYTQACAGELYEALATAKTVLESETGYGAAYELLYTVYNDFLASENKTYVPFDPSLTYVITNYEYSQTMTLNSSNVVKAQASPSDESLTKWKFVATTTDGVYKIQNAGNNYYLPAVVKSTAMTATADAADEAIYTIEETGNVGAWTICLSPTGEFTNLHSADGGDEGRVVGWSVDKDNTKWYLTSVEDNSSSEAAVSDNLAALIAKTEALKNLVGIVVLTGEVGLQADNSDANYYITSNATESGHEPKFLVDNDTETYFHTNWNLNIATAGENHYLQIDFGDAPVEEFTFNYTNLPTTAWNVDAAKTIEVQGANTIDNFTTIATLTSSDSNPLPTAKDGTYSSATLGATGTAYRYLRFTVTNATGDTHHGYYYFGMAELSINRSADYIAVNDEYTNYVTTATLLAAAEEIVTAQTALDAGTDISAAYTALESDYKALETEYLKAIKAKRTELQSLIEQTAALVEETADEFVFEEIESNITLTTNAGDSGYLYCNATIAEGSLGNLLKDDETFIHTQWSGTSADGDYHYLRVDMGEDAKIDRFRFTYTTASRPNADMPGTIVVEGATEIDDDNSTKDTSYFTEITTLTHDASGLPQATNANTTFESEILGTAGTYYRYLRFKVTAITRTTGDVTDDNGYPYFTMAKFGLAKIVSVPTDATVNEAYKTSLVTGDLILAAYLENADATQMKTIATSIEMLQAQIDELQAAYDALYDASITPAEADKTALEELIEATTLLKNDLYEMVVTNYTSAKVTLQYENEDETGYLYCNAPEIEYADWGDADGVKSCIDLTDSGDPNLSTYLHSDWDGDESEDRLDHYLRVDLGADGAANYVEFKYNARSTTLAPSIIEVQACNSLDTDSWTDITTLEGLSATTDEVASGCLGNGTEYRYWRFMVTATKGGGESAGHPYFALTNFEMYTCTDVELSEQLKYTPDIYIYTTSELVTEVENAITAATAVKDNADATQTDVDTEVGELQAVYDKLEEALKYAGLPITITTDENNPVLYKIISKRDNNGGKVLQFDEPASDKVAIVDVADNASYQAWYFMKGTNGYLIKPFNGDGKVLGVSSTGDAQASATIAETATYAEWNFARSTVADCTDYFYIYVNGTSHACLSHNGGIGVTDKMGIWSGGWNTNDPGSLFKFVDAEFENDNARFYQLSDFENTLEFQTSTTPEGTTVGAFTNGDAYSTAYSAAATLIEAGNTSDATACKDAYTALRAASDDLERIEPEAGKIYRIDITPGLTDSRAGASMCIDDNGKLYCDTYAESNARFYFTFEYDDDGNLYMKNLHSATYLDEALNSTDNSNVQVGADAEDIANAKKIAINTLGKSGDAVVVGIVPDGGNMLNCAGKPGNVVAYDNEAVDRASAWVIEEVEPTTLEENVKHTISLAPNTTGDDQITGYSTLNLGYPVTVPAGVKAYIVTNSAIVDNTIELYEYASEGATIPANFPVILRGSTETAATREFQFKNSSVAAVDNVTNLLGGTNYTTYESCLNENEENVYNIYMLTRSGGIVAMRWAYENYDADRNYTGKNDDGGYVKCAANKVYLKLGGTSAANLSATYYFSLFSGTTDIDKIESEENPLDGTIYDLQGRKIDEVKTPGFYIVNGKKMYVNTEMLK